MKLTYAGKELESMASAKNYYNWILDEIRPYLGNCVAEIGAGIGNFTKLLIKNVDMVYAFEPDRDLFKILKENVENRHHIKTINSNLTRGNIKKNQNIDSIIYINVLEHIKNDKSEVSKMFFSLRMGGHAIILVPALPLLFSEFDRKIGHHRRYRRKDISGILQSEGFSITKIKYLDMFGTLPWYISMVLLKQDLSNDKVSIYDKIIPIIRPLENIFCPPFGKNILIIAKKEFHQH